MTTYQTATRPDHRVSWLLAGFALQAILPWLLARAARAAGHRDLLDCGESDRGVAARPSSTTSIRSSRRA